MLAGLDPLQQIAVDQLAGEPDPDPDPWLGLLVQVGRNQVVEGAVQMGQRDVHRDPRDRQPFGGGRWWPGPGGPDLGPDQLELFPRTADIAGRAGLGGLAGHRFSWVDGTLVMPSR